MKMMVAAVVVASAVGGGRDGFGWLPWWWLRVVSAVVGGDDEVVEVAMWWLVEFEGGGGGVGWGRDGAAGVMMIWRRMVVDEWLSWRGRRIDQGLRSTSGIRACALRNFDLEVMKLENTQNNALAKLPISNHGAGFDWSDMAEEEIQTNMALMAFSDSESNSQLNDKGFVDSICSRHMTGNILHLSDSRLLMELCTFGEGAYGIKN
ncbi:hypothetical protein Tco_0581366 [Tanacetum coccineum]